MESTQVNGIRLALVDRGSGVPVLLIHGFPLDHTMWQAQIDALSAGVRVIVPDLRGFGASEAAGDKVTMAEMADDLVGLLDARDVTEPAVVCGLSMGGYVALELCRRHAPRVRALVLCDTRAAPDTDEAARARLEAADRLLREGPAFLADAMLPRLLAEETSEARPDVVHQLRDVILRAQPRGLAAAARGMAERSDATAWLPQIGCPTLVVCGEVDAITPMAEMRTLAEAIPRADFKTIPGAGHMSPMERPEEVNAAMREFLAGV